MQATSIVDAVIALTLFEAAALLAFGRRLRADIAPGRWLWSLAAGLCLMLALRAQLQGDGAAVLALWLMAAGVAHGADQWRRWYRPAAHRAPPTVSTRPRPPLRRTRP